MSISDEEEFISIVVSKIGISYKLQPLLLKQEMEQYENFEEIWAAREDEWLPYVKNDLLSTAFCYARYTMDMEDLTTFVMKNSSTLPSLAIEYFYCLRDDNDELLYTDTDSFMRNFLRQSIKWSRCNGFNHYFKSIFSDNVLDNLSKESDNNGNMWGFR